MNNLDDVRVNTMVTTLRFKDEIFIGATASPDAVALRVVAHEILCLAEGPDWLDSFND
jgi:hypothetical protein